MKKLLMIALLIVSMGHIPLLQGEIFQHLRNNLPKDSRVLQACEAIPEIKWYAVFIGEAWRASTADRVSCDCLEESFDNNISEHERHRLANLSMENLIPTVKYILGNISDQDALDEAQKINEARQKFAKSIKKQ